jgi:hypothetical protein
MELEIYGKNCLLGDHSSNKRNSQRNENELLGSQLGGEKERRRRNADGEADEGGEWQFYKKFLRSSKI